jgi:predicted PurR-regulated permease PerM
VALLPELKFLIGLITAALIIGALFFGRAVLVPLAVAFLLSFILDPWVERLKHLGLPRTAAVIVVVAVALALLALAGSVLGTQVRSISAELPTYQTNIQHKLSLLRERVGKPGMFDGAMRLFRTVKSEVNKAPAAATLPSPSANIAGSKLLGRVQLDQKPPAPFDEALSWLEAGIKPLATAGIVLVFVVLMLLDRVDLRDRLLRLWRGNLHRSTDAMDEAGARIGKYLTMQLVVNLSYGVPMAVGLWFIGVPGAFLWGAVAAVMRFVPYLGPMISALCPLALSFAVDPGWSELLWTIALIGSLELLTINIAEPWLYGTSTGLSAMSIMVAATFWTAMWGPVGLILSTPLTVCLMVIGRHLPRLYFLDVLLGSQPALDTPTRVYQRLLAGDTEEAIELATEQVEASTLPAFYNGIGIPVLRMATHDHASVATAEHRHRVVIGIDTLIDDLGEQQEGLARVARPNVLCIGGKWEVDNLAAKMLAQSLCASGLPAEHRLAAPVNAEFIGGLGLRGASAMCLSYFSPEPQIHARHFCKRLRRRWPNVQIVLALWNAPPELLGEETCRTLGADAVVTSIDEAIVHLAHAAGVAADAGYLTAPIPEEDPARVAALRASGALDPRARAIFDAASHRAADIFDMPMAMVSLISDDTQEVRGAFGSLPRQAGDGTSTRREDLNIPRSLSMCGHVVANAATLVVPDVSRDLRFANNPALQGKLRFYAGAPLRDSKDHILGTLCLLDSEPRELADRDVKLLEALARDIMDSLRNAQLSWVDPPVGEGSAPPAPSAIVGQLVPNSA